MPHYRMGCSSVCGAGLQVRATRARVPRAREASDAERGYAEIQRRAVRRRSIVRTKAAGRVVASEHGCGRLRKARCVCFERLETCEPRIRPDAEGMHGSVWTARRRGGVTRHAQEHRRNGGLKWGRRACGTTGLGWRCFDLGLQRLATIGQPEQGGKATSGGHQTQRYG